MTATTHAGTAVAVAVLTVSDTRTVATDTSGDLIIDRLTKAGHRLADRRLCKDDFETIRTIHSRLGRRSKSRVRDRDGRNRRDAA